VIASLNQFVEFVGGETSRFFTINRQLESAAQYETSCR